MNPKEEVENKYILDLYATVRVLEKEVKRTREDLYQITSTSKSLDQQVEAQNKILRKELKAALALSNIQRFVGSSLKRLKEFLDCQNDVWPYVIKVEKKPRKKKPKGD